MSIQELWAIGCPSDFFVGVVSVDIERTEEHGWVVRTVDTWGVHDRWCER